MWLFSMLTVTQEPCIVFHIVGRNPRVSIIIASTRKKVLLLERSDELAEMENIEVIVVNGGTAGANRNLGVNKSKGELLLFLDDDVVIDFRVLDKVSRHFGDERVGAVGGPNLTMNPANVWERCSGYVLSSPIGSSVMSWRYRVMTGPRIVDERMLTGCNLMVRRKAFLEAGGFPEDIYPAEENILLHKISKLGYSLVYDPNFVVFHRRKGFFGHMLQVFRYGRGRAVMVKRYPDSFKLVFSLPSAGLMIFSSLAVLSIFGTVPIFSTIALAASYFAAVCFESARVCRRNHDFAALHVMMVFFPMHHLAYAVGFLYGLVKEK